MKKTFTRAEVKSIIREVIDAYATDDELNYEFEARLNADGKNGNNGDNEHLREYFEDELIESFM